MSEKDKTYGDTLGRIDDEDARKKVLRLGRYIPRHLEPARLNLPQKLAHILMIKRQASRQQRKEHHTTAPDIRLVSMILFPRHNLRTGIMRAAAARLEKQGASAELERSHPEISDLDLLLLVEQQVLGFEVAVADVELVAVVDAADDLAEVVERFADVEPALGHEVVEELAALDVLEQEVPITRARQSENASARSRTRETLIEMKMR